MENIPSTLKWNNAMMSSYTKNRKVEKNIQIESKSKLDVSERYSSVKTPFDHSYKNNGSKKQFEKMIKLDFFNC